jgi:hypothetical protein
VPNNEKAIHGAQAGRCPQQVQMRASGLETQVPVADQEPWQQERHGHRIAEKDDDLGRQIRGCRLHERPDPGEQQGRCKHQQPARHGPVAAGGLYGQRFHVLW